MRDIDGGNGAMLFVAWSSKALEQAAEIDGCGFGGSRNGTGRNWRGKWRNRLGCRGGNRRLRGRLNHNHGWWQQARRP